MALIINQDLYTVTKQRVKNQLFLSDCRRNNR